MKSYEIYILYCSCLKCCGILSQLYVSGFHIDQKNLNLGDQSTLIEFHKAGNESILKNSYNSVFD